MPKLTRVAVAVDRIKNAIDRDWTDSLYTQARFAMGMDSEWLPANEQDDLPYYPELVPNKFEIGQSRSLMNSIQIVVSRLLSHKVGCKVLHVPPITEEVMQQYLRRRMMGDGTADGSWLEELRAAGVDGNALGVGVVQIGLEADHKTGLQKTTVRRHSPWYTLFDPLEKNLARSNWVCFVHHVSPEVAADLYDFDVDLVRKFVHSAVTSDWGRRKVELVRIFEYFDLGHGGGEPTRILILGTLDVKFDADTRAKIERNEFDVLPFAVCTGWDWPTVRRPFGRIANELNHELARRLAEKRILSTLDQPPIAVFNEQGIDAEDLERYKKGEPMRYLRATGDWKPSDAVHMLPGGQISENEFPFLNYTDRKQSQASHIPDLERGIQTSKRQTRTETLAVLNSGEANRSFEVTQQVMFLQRFLEKLFCIAKEFDRVPFAVELRGQRIEFNQPGVPESWLSTFLGDNYQVLVDEEAMTSAENDLIQSRELAKIQTLAPYVQAGLLPAKKLLDAHLRLIGEDPNDWEIGTQAAAVPTAGGQPTFLDTVMASINGGQDAA